MLLWMAALLGFVVFLFLCGHYDLAASRSHWEMVLTSAGRRELRRLRGHASPETAVVDSAYDGTDGTPPQDATEILRLLELAFSVLAEATPDRLRRLAGMAVCCQMAHAMLPHPPLAPAGFRLRQLATLGGLSLSVHHLLLTTAERIALHVKVLGFGFRLARMSLSRSLGRARREPLALRPWTSFEAGAADFERLDVERFEAFRALLMSFDAEDQAPPHDHQSTLTR